jgi:predicted Zn-dependent protease
MAKAGGSQPQFLSTHPSPDNRMETLQALSKEMRALNPTLQKSRIYPVRMVTNINQL